MRVKGKISYWNSQKGYGFIIPDSGAKRVFVHISSFRNRHETPQIDEVVEFSLGNDKQGRPCAVRVVAAGERLPGEIMRNDGIIQIVLAALFLLLVGLSVLASFIPPLVFVIYLAVSALTYIIYRWDKLAAQSDSWRTSEGTLHLFSLACGWPGALVAQQMLRHKSRKKEFRFTFWTTVVINCGFFIWLFTDSGSDFIQSVAAAIG